MRSLWAFLLLKIAKDTEENKKMEDKEDFIYDEVNGGKGKKKVLDALNKSKLGKHEMDELFCEWG